MAVTKRSALVGVVAAAALAGTAAVAAGTDEVRATCTSNPKVSGKTVASFDVHCSVPLPPPVTVTVNAAPGEAPPASPTPSAAPTVSEWPDETNTGVPAGTELTPYTGPCAIQTAGTVIDAQVINCDRFFIAAPGVTITRSKVNGYVSNDDPANAFTITDSEVDASPNGSLQVTGLGNYGFTALRVNIHGGNRGVNCEGCHIEDSYIHGQDADLGGTWHESAIRMVSDGTIRHNTLLCDAPTIGDAGCSADLTGYGDFSPVTNNLIERNLFRATPSGGFCSYGGSSKGKAFSDATRDIRFIDNVFEKGATGTCGIYGPITSFDPALPGNVWSGNTWEDGTPVPSAL